MILKYTYTNLRSITELLIESSVDLLNLLEDFGS